MSKKNKIILCVLSFLVFYFILWVNEPEEEPRREVNINKRYYGSIESDVYHKEGCYFGNNILSENLIYFTSTQQALDCGYRSCRACLSF